eukprot:scaffold3053_cov83-Skeletonema_menzelii.AAC.1
MLLSSPSILQDASISLSIGAAHETSCTCYYTLSARFALHHSHDRMSLTSTIDCSTLKNKSLGTDADSYLRIFIDIDSIDSALIVYKTTHKVSKNFGRDDRKFPHCFTAAVLYGHHKANGEPVSIKTKASFRRQANDYFVSCASCTPRDLLLLTGTNYSVFCRKNSIGEDISSDAHVEYYTNLWLEDNVTSLGIFNDVSVIKIAPCFSPLIDGENLYDDFEIHCVINGCYRLHHHKSINFVDYETCSVIQDVATSTYVAHYHQVNVRLMLNSMLFTPIVIMDGSLRHDNNNTRCLERHLHYF